MDQQIRVLIYSKDNFFLRSHFTGDYSIERSSSVESLKFLIHEWAPQICIIDSRMTEFTSLRDININPFRMGIIFVDHSYSLDNERFTFKAQFDFYLLKPSPEQLIMRLESICQLKLHREMKKEILIYGNIQCDPSLNKVTRGPETLSLSPLQYKLILSFLSHGQKPLSRQWLLENVWLQKKCSPRSIDAQISKLRKIVPELQIINIYGLGYKLSPPLAQLKVA